MTILTAQLAVVLTTVGLIPLEDVATDEVDLIEVNHFISEQGKLVLDQVIFYDWSDLDCRYNVRAWRLLKSHAQIPQRNWEHREFETVWYDRDVLRRVRCKSVRETWTRYDPELLERKFLPQASRQGLPRVTCRTISRYSQ